MSWSEPVREILNIFQSARCGRVVTNPGILKGIKNYNVQYMCKLDLISYLTVYRHYDYFTFSLSWPVDYQVQTRLTQRATASIFLHRRSHSTPFFGFFSLYIL